jgi:hypothetical protein
LSALGLGAVGRCEADWNSDFLFLDFEEKLARILPGVLWLLIVAL